MKASICILVFGTMLAFVTNSNSQSWQYLSPQGSVPPGRYNSSAISDVANNRMIIFGGLGNSTFLQDVWILTNANGEGGTPTWEQLLTVGGPPSPREKHTAVYDAVNNRMIIHGGGASSPGGFSDVWVLSNANGIGGTPIWTQLSTTGSAPRRYDHSSVYDPGSNRMIVFGGIVDGLSEANDVWVLSNANGVGGTPFWTQIAPMGELPTERFGHCSVYDTQSNRMIIFGGYDQIGPNIVFNDTWALANANGMGGIAAWVRLAPVGILPAARYDHAAVYDAQSRSLIIHGGYNNASQFGDIHYLLKAGAIGESLVWGSFAPSGNAPSNRDKHNLLLGKSRKMICFGGNSSSRLNDVWVLPLPSSITDVQHMDRHLPTGYLFMQNYPNPFNTSTIISFSLPREEFTLLKIFNALGQEVAIIVNENKPAGKHRAVFDASGLPSGVYYYRLQAGGFVETKELVFLR